MLKRPTELQKPYLRVTGRDPQGVPYTYKDLLRSTRLSEDELQTVINNTTLVSGGGGSGGGPSGAGSANQFAYWSGPSTLTSSPNFTIDTVNAIIGLGTNYRLYLGTTATLVTPGTDTVASLRSINDAVRWSIKNSNSGTSAHATLTCVNDEDRYLSFGCVSSTWAVGGDPRSAGEGFLDYSSAAKAGTQRPLFILNRFNSYMRFGTNDTERMRLLAGGPLIIGATAAIGAETLRVNGSVYFNQGLTIATQGVSATAAASEFLQVNAGSTSRTVSGGSPQVYLAAANQCQLYFDVNNASANNKLWDINPSYFAATPKMAIRCINDANTLASEVISIYRNTHLPTSIVLNEDSCDCDFRVEGDTDANLLFSDASADTVQVGSATTADSAKFYVNGKISGSGEFEINGDLNHDGSNIGFFGTAPTTQKTGGENVTNNVTNSGSTDGTIPDITDGTTYANDYTNLRRALYQLARMLKQDHDALRAYGMLT